MIVVLKILMGLPPIVALFLPISWPVYGAIVLPWLFAMLAALFYGALMGPAAQRLTKIQRWADTPTEPNLTTTTNVINQVKVYVGAMTRGQDEIEAMAEADLDEGSDD